MKLSLSEYFCVVFLNLARGRETIERPAVKMFVYCFHTWARASVGTEHCPEKNVRNIVRNIVRNKMSGTECPGQIVWKLLKNVRKMFDMRLKHA